MDSCVDELALISCCTGGVACSAGREGIESSNPIALMAMIVQLMASRIPIVDYLGLLVMRNGVVLETKAP